MIRAASTSRGPSWLPRAVAGLVAIGVCAGLSGCILFGPDVEFLSDRDIIEEVARRCGIQVSEDVFEPVHVQLREDAVLFHYRGVAHPGDHAWLWRFSVKSTEQRPDRLTDPETLSAVLAEGRKSFRLTEEGGSEPLGDATLRWFTYEFEPPIRDDAGQPHRGRGVAGILWRSGAGGDVVFYFNLDNWGDRDEVGRRALDPLVEAMVP